MNFYFLLEDEKSFIKVLPKWLTYMGISNERVLDISLVTENCYVMQSGQGVTQLITCALYDTIDTLIDNPGKIDELVIVLDSESYNEEERKIEVLSLIQNYIQNNNLTIDFSYKVFVCNHCFETWLLGNETLYPDERPDDDFQPFYDYYNVKTDDPEYMVTPSELKESIGSYHFHYLHEMCRHHKIRYSKKNPSNIATKGYFEQLVNRIQTTNHLISFSEFYNYFSNIEVK